MNKYKNILVNVLIAMLILPITVLLVWCFANCWSWPNLLPTEYSLRAWSYLISRESIKAIITSIIISLMVVVITIGVSIPAARALSLYDFRGKKFVELFILSPIIVPTISVAMGIHILFINLGLANTMIGVVLVNSLPCIPYAVRILTDVYSIVGDKLEVQGKVLGASKINVFRYITLPLITPGIISSASMCFIISFGQYFLTFLIGGGTIVTYPMIMFPYIQSGDRTIASLYSVVFLVVSIVVLYIIESKIKSQYIEEKTTFF